MIVFTNSPFVCSMKACISESNFAEEQTFSYFVCGENYTFNLDISKGVGQDVPESGRKTAEGCVGAFEPASAHSPRSH